ncbi:MAG: peptide ABC transporter substrate-binding protein, partial [Pseudomonadota bacterium]
RDSGLNTESVLNRAIGQEPESVDPHIARTSEAHTVQRDRFEGLVRYSPDGEIVPGAAERWDISPDGLIYTFYLRDTGRWSNGDPVLAEDFVASLQRLVDPETASFYAETLDVIENTPAIVAGELPPHELGVSARGDRVLEIRLQRVTPYFLTLLAHAAALPIHPASLAQHGDAFARPGNLVSNGAYRLTDWVLGSMLTIERNAHYWNDAATSIDAVRYHVAEEPSAELFRYRAGELDITSTVPSESFAGLATACADELRVAPALSTYFFGLNLNTEELGESPELREALSLVIDREVLVEKVLGRGEQPAYAFVPPGVANYTAPDVSYSRMSQEDRLARAQQLLREAGYGPDKPLEIEVRYNTSETHRRVAIAVQEMWAEALGVEAELINEEFRVLVANMRAMKITQIFRLTWTGDYNDATAFLSMFQTDNPSNMYGYKSAEFDRLMSDAARQVDPDRRRLYLEEAERVLLEDFAVIPLYYPVSKHLVRCNLRGWEDNALDYHYSQDLEFADR